jgi:outer membrane lipoprotein-sorting protein
MSDMHSSHNSEQPSFQVDPAAERELAELFRRTAPRVPPVDVAALVVAPVNRPWYRRIPMFVRIAAPLAAAAVIAVTFLWPPAQAAASFADMQAEVAKTKTVTFRQTSIVPQQGKADAPPESEQVLVLAPSRVRFETGGGSYSLIDFRKQQAMHVDRANKRVMHFKRFGPIHDGMKMFNLYEFYRDVQEQAVRDLPEREIDGKRCPGFQTSHEVASEFIQKTFTIEMKVWIDPKSKLPVRIEMGPANGKAAAGRVVLNKFVFDKPLDEKLFAFEPPEGYAVQVIGTDTPQEPSADDALQKPVITPGVGIGPVTFGMSLDEVKRQLGEPDKLTPLGGTAAQLDYYASRGYGMHVGDLFGVTTINAVSQPFMAVRVRAFAGKTDKGIGIGSTEAEIREVYGEPSHVDAPEGPGRPTVLYYENLNGSFSLWRGKVHAMTFNIPREKKLEIIERRKSLQEPK